MMKMIKFSIRRELLVFFIVFTVALCFISRVGCEEIMEEQSMEYLKEGIEAQKSGELDRAISLYSKAIYTNPKNIKAHNNLGTAYAQKGKVLKAEEQYNRAIAIDTYYSVALKNLAIIYAERKDYEKFFYYWKRATGLDTYSPFMIDEEE
ncbi:tetratricopeptide repeat protein [Thermoproteota archaeon]